MKKLIVLALIFMASFCYAGAIGDGSITVSSSAQTLSDASITVPATATSMIVAIETGACRVGLKTAPTATTGILLQPGQTITVYGKRDISAFKIIFNNGVSSATARVIIFN